MKLFAKHNAAYTVDYIIPTFSKLLISILYKGNHDHEGVWISDLNKNKFLRFYSIDLVSIEKIYQALKTVF